MGASTLGVCFGHGGKDPGNTSTHFIERDELISISHAVATWFRLRRVPLGIGGVVFVDNALDLEGEIAAINGINANIADGDLAVNLHLDYQPQSTGGGALVIADEIPLSERFGTLFLERWCEATGIPNRGIHRSTVVAPRWRGWADFGFCAASWPGIIIELGTLNAHHDMEILRSPLYQAFIGELLWECWQSCNA